MRTDRQILAAMIRNIQEQDDPLSELIDRYYMVRELPRYRKRRLRNVRLPVMDRARPKGRLSPSSICGCERQAAFVYMGVKGRKRVDPEAEAIFEDGKWRHHKLQYVFNDMARMFPSKFRVLGIEEPVMISRFRIAGHLDARVEIFDGADWHEYVVDFKGANSWAWEYVFRNQKPKSEHVKQLLAYMKAKRVRRGLLVYEDKNTNSIQVFMVKMTKDEWAEIGEWCDRVLAQMAKKQLPPMHPDCNQGKFLFGKCPFKGLCYGDAPSGEIEKMVYKDFEGVEAAWEEGKRIAAT